MSIQLTLLERALLSIAPTLAMRRIQARVAANEFVRNYDGASRDRRLGNWRASATGPNAEIGRHGELIRSRARDLAQNNKAVAAAKLQFMGKTVGTGITPRAVHPGEPTRQAAEDAWARFVDSCDPDGQQDYYGLQSLTAGSMFIDGECLQMWLPDHDGSPNAQIKVLEADMLDDRQVGNFPGQGRRVVAGIEFDAWNRRVAYVLHQAHPGEADAFGVGLKTERVPAALIDHYFHVARPGQLRGVSWLAPSIVGLRGCDDVKEAIIWRKRLEACLGLIVRSPETMGSAPIVGRQRTDSKGRVEEELAPGKIIRLGPGEDVTTLDPAPSGDAMEFLRSELYAFCATVGVSYHEITGDASQANYSSMRAAKIAGDVLIDMIQWLVFAPRIKAAWRRVMQREYALTGRREFLAVRCELAMPIRPWVDPLKDITSKILELRAGLQSMPDALAERGVSWQKQIAEIEKWVAATEAAGLVFDTDPSQVDRTGAMQALQAITNVAGNK
ncbi:phage portal protein [Methylocystis sp. IM3]|uniref:phage portal protein n=1 Tax=unclassified Methylocystis TaxID=2625913 RepID=UPI003119C006